MTVAIYTYFIILKSTFERRKRDLYRRTSSIALSVCKILRRPWNTPDWWLTSEKGCPHLQTGNHKGIQCCRWWLPISLSRPLRPCVLLRAHSHIKPFSLVRCHEHERRSSQWYVIRFLNHRILSSCRLMFDRSSGKGKTQIGMAKLQAPRGFGEISTPAEGVVFRRKNFANPILLPLREPQERTNGDRKTQKKKTVDSRKRN